MARTGTIEGQALWQPGGAEDDSHFREGNRHLCLAQGGEEEEVKKKFRRPNPTAERLLLRP